MIKRNGSLEGFCAISSHGYDKVGGAITNTYICFLIPYPKHTLNQLNVSVTIFWEHIWVTSGAVLGECTVGFRQIWNWIWASVRIYLVLFRVGYLYMYINIKRSCMQKLLELFFI